jgi:hypothetical protein
MRTLITGSPKTGKTTLALELAEKSGVRHFCTDPQNHPSVPAGVSGTPVGLDWSECSLWVAQHWLELPGSWVIEGVAVPRALRKWHAEHPDAPPPCDSLLVLVHTHEPLTPRHAKMSQDLHGVLDELRDWLAPVLRYV